MKTIEVETSTGTLADYVDSAAADTVILTRGGKPVAAIVPLQNADAESVALSTNPKFLAIIERSRTSARAKGTISAEDLRREFAGDDDAEGEPAP